MIRSNAASASVLSVLEHAGGDPLVAPGSQRGVRDLVLEDRFDVDPRRAGHQADQRAPGSRAGPALGAGDSPADGLDRWREQRLDRCQMTSTTSGSSARMSVDGLVQAYPRESLD